MSYVTTKRGQRPWVPAALLVILAASSLSCGSEIRIQVDGSVASACSVANGGCDVLTFCREASGAVVCGPCPFGFTGSGANGCADLDECAINNGGCSALVTCNNLFGGFVCGPCPIGNVDDGAGGCTDLDECIFGNGGCSQTCTNSNGSFACSCLTGFTLNSDGMTCDDINECTNNNGGCDALALCTNTTGGRDCGLCPMGFTDDNGDGTVCTDINECDNNNGGCSTLTLCTNTPGGFMCGSCPPGYLDDGAGGCDDINECDNNDGGCDVLTMCINTEGSRTCTACPSGFTGTGVTGCTNVDECESNNGGCEDLCGDLPGTFFCSCGLGFMLNVDGSTCDDVDECGFGNGGCGDATAYDCTNNVGAPPTCSCAVGHQDNNNDDSCEPTCATAFGGSPLFCGPGPVCSDASGTALCPASVISINIGTASNALFPLDLVGVVPAANWNNVGRAGSNAELVFGPGLANSFGGPTSVTFRANGRAPNSEEKMGALSVTPNATMMRGEGHTSIRPTVGVGGEFVTQQQLTNVFSNMGGSYSVYVYYGTGFLGDFMGGTGAIILSSGEYTFTSTPNGAEQHDVPTMTVIAQSGYRTMRGTSGGFGAGPTWDDTTGFIQSTGVGVAGNYVRFTGVTAENLVITINPTGVAYEWNQTSILGIQIEAE